MFIPHLFEETNIDKMHAVIARNPLGAVIINTANGLDANHIPFHLDPTSSGLGTLRAHFSREHPFGQQATRGCDCLILFQGPSAYVSPSWYPSRNKHGKVQPSWYYAVVHAYGRLNARDDPEWLAIHLRDMTDRLESSQPDGWNPREAPADFMARLMLQVVGIEIRIERLLGKWQVGQQKNGDDLAGIITGLQATAVPSNEALIELMLGARAERGR
jgi:transcriptional regulator